MTDPTQNSQLSVKITSTGYPAPSIEQWRLGGQSIPGASTGDHSFDPSIAPGSISYTATFPNFTPPVWDGTPMAIVIVGDSTSGDQGFGDPTATMPAEMLAFSGRILTIVANCYANGTTTRDWADAGPTGLLATALAKAKSGKATHVPIALGPNDCSVLHNITAIEFKANLIRICQAIIANGQKVILHYGLIPLVSASLNTWTQASIDLGLSYRPMIDSLIDGKDILLGDTKLADYLRNNPSTYQGGTVQQSPLVGGFHQADTGKIHSGRMWAEGCEFAVNPAARTLGSTWEPLPLVNPDKSINWENRAKYWDDWSKDAHSKRMGGHWKKFHPGNPPDQRESYYQYPVKTEYLLRTLFGKGDTITTDKDLGHPGQNFLTWECPNEVKPWQFSLNGPGADPSNGNLRDGLPSDATDILDPGNNPAGYHTTTGDVSLVDYQKTPTAYTILSGRGDGFTPPEILLQGHRQGWVDQGGGKFSQIMGGDYWSVRGHVVGVPADTTTDGGVRRKNGGAYYSLVLRATPIEAGGPLPKDETSSSQGMPGYFNYLYWAAFQFGDPATAQIQGNAGSGYKPSDVVAVTGARMAHPLSIYVSDKIICGEALCVDPSLRIMTVLSSGTSRDSDQYPIPVYQFPPGEIPIHVSISDMNELAAVVVWTATGSKIVIFALQGYALRNHSQPWYGFSNLGSFSGFRRICEQVLPFACADKVKIGTDAALAPQPDPGSINLADPAQRSGYANFGDQQRYPCFPKKAWFAATSREEGQFKIYDFTAWMSYVWSQYMEPDQAKWMATRAAHDDGTFPPTIAARPDLAPVEELAFAIDRPTCMIASGYGGPEIGWDYSDFQKLVIGCEDGTCQFVNISWYVDTYNWTGFNPPNVDWSRPRNRSLGGSIWVGRGLIDLEWAHFTIPNSEIHYLNVMNAVTTRKEDKDAHGFANAFYAVCRGEREVRLVINHFDLANSRQVSGIHLRIKSNQLLDPSCCCMQDRFNLLDVGDFDGEGICTFQKGWIGRGAIGIYPGFYFPPDPRDQTKPIGLSGKYKPGWPVRLVDAGNAN